MDSELIVRPGTSTPKSFFEDDIRFELNLGIALPLEFRSKKGRDKTKPYTAKARAATDNGNLYDVIIQTQSSEGGLKGNDEDVISILTTILADQVAENIKNGSFNRGTSELPDKVFVANETIRRRMGLKKNSVNKITRIINKLKNTKLKVKTSKFDATEKTFKKIEIEEPIIKGEGHLLHRTMSSNTSSDKGVRYLQLHSFIAESIVDKYVGIINAKEWRNLKTGPERKIFIFLSGKREFFGDNFAFSIMEILQVLCAEESSDPRKKVRVWLKDVKDKTNAFDFKLATDKASEGGVRIHINFNESFSSSKKELGTYEMLRTLYGDSLFNKLDFRPEDIDILKKEFCVPKDEVVTFGEYRVCPLELCIDIMLFQHVQTNYEITSFKGLAKTFYNHFLDESIKLPDSYRACFKERFEQIEKDAEKSRLDKERHEKEMFEKKEKERLSKSFDIQYELLCKTDSKFKKLIGKMADDVLANDKDPIKKNNPLYKKAYESQMKEVARKLFENGELYEHIKFEDVQMLEGTKEAFLIN